MSRIENVLGLDPSQFTSALGIGDLRGLLDSSLKVRSDDVHALAGATLGKVDFGSMAMGALKGAITGGGPIGALTGALAGLGGQGTGGLGRLGGLGGLASKAASRIGHALGSVGAAIGHALGGKSTSSPSKGGQSGHAGAAGGKK